MMLNAWHLPVPPFVKQSKDQLLITLWLTGEAPPQRIMLRTEHDNEEMSVPMHKQRSQPQPGVTAWRAAIDLSSGQPRRRYSFKLLWHDRQRWFTPQGFSRMPPARLEQFAVDVPDIGPQWAADQIFYQIFPDRFARSLPREAEQDHVYYHHAAGQEIILRDWDEPVTAQAGGSTFYGGDLDGISEKLPYLKKLGVTALYLNPVFKAPSVHKYDTEDYRHVDPQFGGDGALLRLRHNTQQLGMRLVLDGVFNHSGDSHAWFDRHNRGTGGACHNPESPWRDWYSFSDDGTALDWLGYASLPKLDYQSESLVNEIYRGEDSIVRHWLKAPWNMDGWRLDVAADLGHSPEFNHKFWKEFRRVVKEANPEAIILAEHYGDAMSWLQGDEWDTVMNYDAFMEPVSWFLTGMEKHSDEFNQGLLGNSESFIGAMTYHMPAFYAPSLYTAMNELDNHDHSRFLTRTNHRVGRVANVGPYAAAENTNKAVLREAVVIQMTWPGAPTLYYGDEAGQVGFTDPDNRRTYPWGQEDQELIRFYKEMIAVHRRFPVLAMGSLKFLYHDYNVLSYGRFNQEEQVIVVINNRNERVHVEIPVWLTGINRSSVAKLTQVFATDAVGFSSEEKEIEAPAGILEMDLLPLSGVVLHRCEE